MASREPVDAPDGTAARPMVPDSSSTSHSTVGLPRLSRISRPTMSTMALIQSSSWIGSKDFQQEKIFLNQRLLLDPAIDRQQWLGRGFNVLQGTALGPSLMAFFGS